MLKPIQSSRKSSPSTKLKPDQILFTQYLYLYIYTHRKSDTYLKLLGIRRNKQIIYHFSLQLMGRYERRIHCKHHQPIVMEVENCLQLLYWKMTCLMTCEMALRFFFLIGILISESCICFLHSKIGSNLSFSPGPNFLLFLNFHNVQTKPWHKPLRDMASYSVWCGYLI